MGTSGRESAYRGIVSLFIGLVLFAQAATIPFTAVRSPLIWLRLYPIVEYDMYREAHKEGDSVDATWMLDGVYADGTVIEISRQMLQFEVWDFISLMSGVLNYKLDANKAHLIKLVQTRVPNGKAIRELRIKTLGIRVTKNGPEKIPQEVVMTIPISDDSTSTQGTGG